MEKDKSRDRGVRYTQSLDGGVTFDTTKLIDANACPCCNVQTALAHIGGFAIGLATGYLYKKTHRSDFTYGTRYGYGSDFR